MIIRSKQLYGKKHKPKRISNQALESQTSKVLPLHFVEKQTNKQKTKQTNKKTQTTTKTCLSTTTGGRKITFGNGHAQLYS